jgi:hypothetical protein
MPLTRERNTPARHSGQWAYKVAAGVHIMAGALVVLEAGYARPGKTGTGLVAVGRAEETVDNAAGAAGAARVRVERGTFLFANSATDPITQAEVGTDCFVVDDETVAKTDGAGTRSRAGIVREVEIGGVWVEF